MMLLYLHNIVLNIYINVKHVCKMTAYLWIYFCDNVEAHHPFNLTSQDLGSRISSLG